MRRASSVGGINTNRFSPEQLELRTLLVRPASLPMLRKTSVASDAAAGYWEAKWAKWRDMVADAVFTSAQTPLQQQPCRIKLFPLDGWKCDQSTSHSLAPKRCHSSGEVRVIKPMFAVCYLNTLTQNGNHRQEYHIFIIDGLFWWLWRRGTMHRSLLLLLILLFICSLSCCHSTTRVVVDDTCFSGKSFDWTQVWLGPTAAPPARLTLARQLVRGEVATRESRQLFPRRCGNTSQGSDNCVAYERAATLASAHRISFSLLSGTTVRGVKGESFDVEKMKNRFCCRVWPDKQDCGKSFVYWSL